MEINEAIYVLQNTAWLGTDTDREKVEAAVEIAVDALLNQYAFALNSFKNGNLALVTRCRDCIYYLRDDDDEYGICSSTGAGYPEDGFCSDGERKGNIERATDSEDGRGWISVKDRLPDEDVCVMVAVHDSRADSFDPLDDSVDIDCRENGRWDRYCGDIVVTHWMPLPELPKEETE